MDNSRQLLNYILTNIEQCHIDLERLAENISDVDKFDAIEYRIVETRLETLNDILKYWHYIEGSPL